ncbi:MAG: allantoicase [Sandaracinaceae bacterium]|nr:allantoicase [Sandaracinaceae bacterium]
MSHAAPSNSFTGLIDLASAAVGGEALECSDDFFAPMSALIDPRPAVFDPDAYTDRGKLMDGWESRRKRVPGHDWCVLRLGVPGVIRALDVDTSFFLGNHPPFCSLEAKREGGEWEEILPQSPLRPGSSNLFAIGAPKSYTHLRLHIYPDGGVARLRVYGEPEPRWDPPDYDEATRPHVKGGEVDLAALVNGGKALACSDAFFGPMNNLLLPGRARNMGGGWETRRKRALPGDDWILVRLGAAGTLSLVELVTCHFKGNYPDRASLEAVHAPGARITDLIASSEWKEILPPSKLSADTRHFFPVSGGPYTHLRLRIYPDGGISRLRAWGRRA